MEFPIAQFHGIVAHVFQPKAVQGIGRPKHQVVLVAHVGHQPMHQIDPRKYGLLHDPPEVGYSGGPFGWCYCIMEIEVIVRREFIAEQGLASGSDHAHFKSMEAAHGAANSGDHGGPIRIVGQSMVQHLHVQPAATGPEVAHMLHAPKMLVVQLAAIGNEAVTARYRPHGRCMQRETHQQDR